MGLIRKWIPVNPMLDDKGEFISLKGFDGKQVKPNPLSEADMGRSEFGEEYKLGVSHSSKLELSAIGGIDSNLTTTTFVHDSIIFRLSRGNSGDPDQLIKGTWWGYGLRLRIVIKNIQFGVNLNWGSVSAVAQLGYADAEFEIESIGISNSELFSLLPAPTDLNMDTFQEILSIGDTIRNLVRSSDPEGVIYKPLRIQVDVPSAELIDPIGDDRHLIFTYQQVRSRTKLKHARKNAVDHNLNPDTIAGFYKELFGIEDEGQKPSFADRREARDWLDI